MRKSTNELSVMKGLQSQSKVKTNEQSPNAMQPSKNASNNDNVRHIVEQEGRTARNLITWSVPVAEQSNENFVPKAVPHGRKRHRNQNRAKQRQRYHSESDRPSFSKSQIRHEGRRDESNSRATKSQDYQNHIQKLIDNEAQEEFERPRSAQENKKDSLRARYWSFLFENLQRAVDEIYKTCDNDESIVECQEVIMMLDSCKKDFVALIRRIDMFNEIEKKDAKNRPHSLAWEVRKMSPGKCISPTPVLMSGRRSSSPVQRSLNFDSATAGTASPSAGISWADKVKGIKTENFKARPPSDAGKVVKPPASSPITEAEDEEVDDSGWEVVSRGRHRSRGSSSSVSLKNAGSHDSIEDNIGKAERSAEPGKVPLILMGTGSSAFEKMDKSSPYSVKSNDTSIYSDEVEEIVFSLTSGSCVVDETEPVAVSNEGSWTVLSSKVQGKVPSLEEMGRQPSIEELILQADMDTYIKEQQEEDLRDRKIEEENEKALASAIEEEEHLTKELEDEALKNMEDDDTEDISSDKEGGPGDDGLNTPRDNTDLDDSLSFEESSTKKLSWDEILAQYDKDQMERQEDIGWGELSETDSKRPPGRALEMHQKLSSPSRRRPRAESVRISEERMIKAERKRLKLLESKCHILKSLSEKVRSVRALKNKIISEQEYIYKEKMKVVEQKRQLVLQEKIKKAQEEEAKVNEIAFINSLEAQNKKIEVQEKHQTMEARLQEILDERQRKRDEQQAREEAAQERRKGLEAVRRARLEEILLKRQEQETKREKEKLEKEKAREEAIRERQRDREMKAAARNEAFQQATEELQKKIELKQLESSRRHEERIVLVKEKAASSSRHTTVEEAPSIIPYERKKQCTLCSAEIISELFMVSHLKGKTHREAVKDVNRKISDVEIEGFSMKYIKDLEEVSSFKQTEREEYQKAMKKRLKKIKSRMNQKGREYEANSSNEEKFEDSQKRARLQRSLKDINKLLQAQGSTYWPANKVTALDRALGEISRLLEDKNEKDQRTLCQIGGLAVLTRVLLLLDTSSDKKNSKPIISDKILIHASNVIQLVCDGNHETCQYMLLSNKLSTLIDLLNYRMDPQLIEYGNKENQEQATDQIKEANSIALISSLLQALTTLTKLVNVDAIANGKKGTNDAMQRVNDLVSYVVCSGVLEKYYQMFQYIQEPLEDTTTLQFNNQAILMMHGLVISLIRVDTIFVAKKDDPTLLLQFLKKTQLVGLLSLMYALLHHSGSTRVSPSPFPLSEMTISILTSVLRLINLVALLDLNLLQKILAAEGNSLQLRSVASYLLRYCSTQNSDELLFELVITVGYFTVLHKDNQAFIQTGRAPTILQQLGLLPFQYFSDPKLRRILLPTLISCCYESVENKTALEQEISPTLLASFIEENIKEGKSENISQRKEEFYIGDGASSRASLGLRFPTAKWDDALKYFSEEKKPAAST